MKYYVVYTTGGTIGACTVDLKLPVRNIDDVKLMTEGIKEIRKKSSPETIVILNWKELEEEDDEIY